jgi:aminoglycoside phosphotransferase (APT) family kinase protein
VADDDAERDLIARALAQPVSDATRAVWGFTNRTDMVTLEGGERLILQRYQRRSDAEYRLRVMRGLSTAAAEADIPVPTVREANLEDDPPWVSYEALPGVPVADAGEVGVGGARFPEMARTMGQLLAKFRRLPTSGIEIDDRWAHPERLAVAAAEWAEQIAITDADRYLDGVAELFAGRPVVLAHGDFAPVNVLIDGDVVTGLLDFEATRLADPLFDVAWWAWSVSFAPTGVLDAAWPAFLDGAGIDANEPRLADRIRMLQVLRMLELLATGTLSPDVAGIVRDRLQATLS